MSEEELREEVSAGAPGPRERIQKTRVVGMELTGRGGGAGVSRGWSQTGSLQVLVTGAWPWRDKQVVNPSPTEAGTFGEAELRAGAGAGLKSGGHTGPGRSSGWGRGRCWLVGRTARPGLVERRVGRASLVLAPS